MVAGQLPHLGSKAARSIREENLGLAVATGVEEDLTGSGVTGRILEADTKLKISEGNPRRLTAPANVNDLVAEGEPQPEGGTRLRCGLVLHPRPEPIWPVRDPQDLAHMRPFPVP